MKHLLLTTIAAVLVVGCSDPEAEANKLFTEASQLVREADAITESYSLEAYNKRKAAVELLERIPVQYPQSSLSVKISEGDFKIQSQSTDEIRKKMKPEISIHEATKEGNSEAVKQHLATGTDVNAKDGAEDTPLHHAANEGHKEVVELLIAKGADVNGKSDSGLTPLHHAVAGDHKETAELLIAKGADVNAKGDGVTPLHIAAWLSQKGTAELLIAKGADVNAKLEAGTLKGQTPLDRAILYESAETADLLRKHGGISGAADSIHVAAAVGNIETVKQHLVDGTDVNSKDEDGLTPLHSAAFIGHKEIAELLIAKGADLNAKSDDGYTPLHAAALYGHTEIAELLIEEGADVNAKKNSGRTPLDHAITGKHPELADLLRKHGGKTGEELKAEGK
jgi:ankyrin repeat protein